VETTALLKDARQVGILINDIEDAGRMQICEKGIGFLADGVLVAKDPICYIREGDLVRAPGRIKELKAIIGRHHTRSAMEGVV
jgi:hypothetical protein